MIVLHAGIYEDRLFLWGETSDVCLEKLKRDKDTKNAANVCPQYAFDLGPEHLINIMRTIPGKFKPKKKMPPTIAGLVADSRTYSYS